MDALHFKIIIYILVSIVLQLYYANTVYCQWKRLNFSFENKALHTGLIYFQDEMGYPASGFVGSYPQDRNGNRNNITGELWKTDDGGNNWKKVSSIGWSAGVRDIFFKDHLNGWVATWHLTNNGEYGGGCYRTKDGGETWTFLNGSEGPCSGVYYNRFTHILIINRWENESLLSFDEGSTLTAIPDMINGNGICFFDSLNGFTSHVGGGGVTPLAMFSTSNGGGTWEKTTRFPEAWQPLVFSGSKTAYAISEYVTQVYRSNDRGITWNTVATFTPNFTGCIRGDTNFLFIQNDNDILVSYDYGVSWTSMCGPGNSIDTRFYYYNGKLYSGDIYGNIWLNVSGKGKAPRFQVEFDNTNRKMDVSISDTFPVRANYAKEANYEKVDSVTFTLSFDKTVSWVSDSVATGWEVMSVEDADTNVTYHLRRTDPADPALNSFVIAPRFQAVVTTTKDSARFTLGVVNFNNDITFHDCLISSLNSMDTFVVNIHDRCGDSILRAFLITNPFIKILSIYPNPTKGDVTIDFNSLLEGECTIRLITEGGFELNKMVILAHIGVNSYKVSTNMISQGACIIQMQMGSNIVNGKFIKE